VSTPLYSPCRASNATAAVLTGCLMLPAAFAQTAPEVSASGIESAEAGPARDPGATASSSLVRVTSSFEVTHAEALLRQVAKLFSAGFIRKDAEQLARMIDALAAEQSRTWEFSGVRKGVSYPLRVRARIDEFGMLDLDFFTSPALAPSVRGAVDGYLNARGL
jgi:hypothetical protein